MAAVKIFLLLLEITTLCPGLAPILFFAIAFSSDWKIQLSQLPQLLPQAVERVTTTSAIEFGSVLITIASWVMFYHPTNGSCYDRVMLIG